MAGWWSRRSVTSRRLVRGLQDTKETQDKADRAPPRNPEAKTWAIFDFWAVSLVLSLLG